MGTLAYELKERRKKKEDISIYLAVTPKMQIRLAPPSCLTSNASYAMTGTMQTDTSGNKRVFIDRCDRKKTC